VFLSIGFIGLRGGLPSGPLSLVFVLLPYLLLLLSFFLLYLSILFSFYFSSANLKSLF